MTVRWTWHGGGLAAARAHFGRGDRPWIDLSTGINPQGWPGANAIPIDWQHLPDEGELHALEQAAADYFGTRSDHVCAVPGTEVGLRLMGSLLTGPVCHVAPAYRTHGDMAGQGRPVAIDRMADAAGQTLILANPNNPDGRLIDPAKLLGLAEDRGGDGWLIVDEAFADPMPATSIAAHVRDDRRLILFRSFGKFFGLAGLRLGFLIAPRPMVARFRALLGAWPVSAAALAIGTAAYRDVDWIAATRTRLDRDVAVLDAVLAEAGLRAIGQCPLFRLVESEDAARLFDRLARQAILTRPFDHDPHWLRIGLPADAAEFDRLQAALHHG